VSVVVDVRFAAVLSLRIVVRHVRVLQDGVVVLVAVVGQQVLDPSRAGVRVVRDVHVIVPVYQRMMVVRHDILLRHGYAPFLDAEQSWGGIHVRPVLQQHRESRLTAAGERR
jgi:hypothetical protein